jgi:hypothetical protein
MACCPDVYDRSVILVNHRGERFTNELKDPFGFLALGRTGEGLSLLGHGLNVVLNTTSARLFLLRSLIINQGRQKR